MSTGRSPTSCRSCAAGRAATTSRELVAVGGTASGRAARIPFVVRAPPDDETAILVVAPVDTWQAYNDYGGADYYTGSGVKKASRVSFNRPYQVNWSQSPLYYDYPLIRFLERSGYDVSYHHRRRRRRRCRPATLLRHRLIVVPGHSEYWSGVLRDGLQHARDAGVNLAFLGGNDGYREISYENAGRTMVKGDFFRRSALPECGHRRRRVAGGLGRRQGGDRQPRDRHVAVRRDVCSPPRHARRPLVPGNRGSPPRAPCPVSSATSGTAPSRTACRASPSSFTTRARPGP